MSRKKTSAMAERDEAPPPFFRASRKQAARQAVMEELDSLDWRVLSWLLRYPLQRADDLVVGMARWTSRATVYRHLHQLTGYGLIESVVPKTPAEGKRLYHLSNLGLHLLAAHLGTSARTLARDWRVDDAGLMRLLPRLPIVLSVQDMVNGLVTHAAEAVTVQGRRPTLVRWNWQRDLFHRFRFRDQTVRLDVDGAVSLCAETPQADGGLKTSWYGLLLLCTTLDDEQRMQRRLERLLLWRESPERWSVYQHMLPVLVLAQSPRQADHWQQAMTQAIHHLRVAPLVGAITCLSSEEGQQQNPWQRAWRTLSTGTGCHLSDVLAPLSATALPSSLQTDGGDSGMNSETDDPRPCHPLPVRLSCLIRGQLTARATTRTGEGQQEPILLPLLSLQLTPMAWQVLSLLLAHPLLSTDELAALLSVQVASVRSTLSALQQPGCITPVATTDGQRWHLCERGFRLVAAANRVPLHAIAIIPDSVPATEAAQTIVQPSVPWLLRHIQHTAGVNGFFARLAQVASQQPGHALCWWETGSQCERRYRVNEQWHNLRPDALADYRVGQRHLRFWLEWDRGTMNGRDLTIKFTAYAHYLASREWTREHTSVPLLLCVAPDIAQEQRITRVAQTTRTTIPGLVLMTTTVKLLTEYGPLGAIWTQHSGLPKDATSAGHSRRSMFCNGY